MFIYTYFWISTTLFIFISRNLMSLQGLTKAARTGSPLGIFISTGRAEGICSGYHFTAWCNHKATVHFTCTVAPDSHRMWLFFASLPLTVEIWAINPSRGISISVGCCKDGGCTHSTRKWVTEPEGGRDDALIIWEVLRPGSRIIRLLSFMQEERQAYCWDN